MSTSFRGIKMGDDMECTCGWFPIPGDMVLLDEQGNAKCPKCGKKLGMKIQEEDWTAKDGISNSSDEYLKLVAETTRLIKECAFDLIAGRAHVVARLIIIGACTQIDAFEEVVDVGREVE